MLRIAADIRTLCFVASFYVGIFMLWNFSLSWLYTILLYLWVIIAACAGSTITHNTVHTPVFYSHAANRVLWVLLTCIYGMPVTLFVPVHNLSHHKYTQTRKDITRSMKLRSKYNLVNMLRAASRIGPDTMRDDIKYFSVQYKRGSPVVANLFTEFLCLLTFAGACASVNWKLFLVLVFIPWQASQCFIMGMNFVQHDGCELDMEGYNHSRNFVGPLFNFLFFNNGFHTIHHQKAGLHWSKTPEAHKKVIAPHIHPNLDIKNGFTFFYDYWFAPGTRRDYLGKPFMPPPPGEDESWGYETDEMYSEE